MTVMFDSLVLRLRHGACANGARPFQAVSKYSAMENSSHVQMSYCLAPRLLVWFLDISSWAFLGQLFEVVKHKLKHERQQQFADMKRREAGRSKDKPSNNADLSHVCFLTIFSCFLGMNPNFDLLRHLIQLTWRIIILAFVQLVPLSNNFGVNYVIPCSSMTSHGVAIP